MSDVILDVMVRESTGTGAARATRRAGFVPGVLYGGDEGSVAISLKMNEVLKALNTGNLLGSMVKISHKGEKQSAITKNVQFHPVKDMPQHIDFYRVSAKTIITISVSIHLINEELSEGLSAGGRMNMVRHEIEVSCPAGSIPDHIDLDIADLQIGDTINVSDLKMPKDVVSAITDRDPTILTLLAARAEVEEEEETEVIEGEEAVEGGGGAEVAGDEGKD
ncbi:MAG: 50S ribosomal protein L25/general stress protein Ctc [Robiginitomaculum sp.]